jgi:hypothetical protein
MNAQSNFLTVKELSPCVVRDTLGVRMIIELDCAGPGSTKRTGSHEGGSQWRELHYFERGQGEPVVFVLGALDDYRAWNAQISPFAEHFRVIAYSRRYNFPNKNAGSPVDHSAIV